LFCLFVLSCKLIEYSVLLARAAVLLGRSFCGFRAAAAAHPRRRRRRWSRRRKDDAIYHDEIRDENRDENYYLEIIRSMMTSTLKNIYFFHDD
jgi:hypothetical protein